jgi:hypothetical protein
MNDDNKEEREFEAINLGGEEETESVKAIAEDPKATEEFVQRFAAHELFSHLHRYKGNLVQIIQESTDIDSQQNNLFKHFEATYDQMYKVLGDYVEQKGYKENVILAFGHELDNLGSNLKTSMDVLTRVANKVRNGENKDTYKTAVTNSTEKCKSFIQKLDYFIGHIDTRLTEKDLPIPSLVLDAANKLMPLLEEPIEIAKGNLDDFKHFRVQSSVKFQLAMTEIIKNASKSNSTKVSILTESDSSPGAGVSLQMIIYTNGSRLKEDSGYLDPKTYSSFRGIKLIRSLGFSYDIKNNESGEGCIATLQFPVKFANSKPPVEA